MKLNLGCGYEIADGWENVDKLDYGAHIHADILDGLPYDDDYFDFVLMNHTLQVFTYNELAYVLQEVRRVMKPDATLRILIPDMDKAIINYQTGNADYFPIDDSLEVSMSGKFARYMFWHGETRCAFSYESLMHLLVRNGFKDVRLGEFGDCELDSRESESLIVEATK